MIGGLVITPAGATGAASITGGTITGLTDLGVSMANNTAMTGFALGTITDTTSRPFTITQTWNNSGLTATALRVNVTDTSSATASLLQDWQVGGSTKWSIAKNATGGAYASAWRLVIGAEASIGWAASQSAVTFRNAANTGQVNVECASVVCTTAGQISNYVNVGDSVHLVDDAFDVPGVHVKGTGQVGFHSGSSSTSTCDAFFTRRAAGALYMGASLASAWVNQAIGPAGAIVGTTTNGSPTNTLTIHGSVSTGTGTGGDIILGVYGTNGSSGTAIGTLNTVLSIIAARKVVNISNIPTSSVGLSAGDVYSNAGILTIV